MSMQPHGAVEVAVVAVGTHQLDGHKAAAEHTKNVIVVQTKLPVADLKGDKLYQNKGMKQLLCTDHPYNTVCHCHFVRQAPGTVAQWHHCLEYVGEYVGV